MLFNTVVNVQLLPVTTSPVLIPINYAPNKSFISTIYHIGDLATLKHTCNNTQQCNNLGTLRILCEPTQPAEYSHGNSIRITRSNDRREAWRKSWAWLVASLSTRYLAIANLHPHCRYMSTNRTSRRPSRTPIRVQTYPTPRNTIIREIRPVRFTIQLPPTTSSRVPTAILLRMATKSQR